MALGIQQGTDTMPLKTGYCMPQQAKGRTNQYALPCGDTGPRLQKQLFEGNIFLLFAHDLLKERF